MQCWGYNGDGELGNGTTTDSYVPSFVSNIGHATTVAANAYHTCALLTGGWIQCWGDNNDGELGNGTTTNSSLPILVIGF